MFEFASDQVIGKVRSIVKLSLSDVTFLWSGVGKLTQDKLLFIPVNNTAQYLVLNMQVLSIMIMDCKDVVWLKP